MSVAKTLPFLLIVLLASGFAFPQAPQEGPTEIRFSYWASHKDNDMYRQICENFEAQNPDVVVKREWYVGDYGRKLPLALISETACDVILMDDEIFPTYFVRGYLEDLTPYIKRDAEELRLDEFLPTSLESFNYQGHQGGMPWDGNAVMIFYNKDLFDDPNRDGDTSDAIPYPERDWTWDDFREIAKKLTQDFDGDTYNDQFGTNMGFGFLGFEPILWCFGGRVLNEDHTKCALQEPKAIEAAQFIYDMKYVDLSIAWTGEMEGFNTEVQLLTGRVGMVPAASYMFPALNRVQDAMRWGVAHMPIGPYGDRYTRVTWDGISIYSKTTPEKKEAAWRFIKYFLSTENQRLIATTQRGLPVRRPVVESHYIDPDTPADEQLALDACDYARLTPITPRYLELRDAMASEFDRLNTADAPGGDMANWIKPAEALAAMEPKVNKVLEKEQFDAWEREEKEIDPHSHWKAFGVAVALISIIIGVLMSFRPVRRGFRTHLDDAKEMWRSRRGRSEAFEGVLFASPWLIGVILFQAFPIFFSIVLSFCEWDPYTPISQMNFIGLGNFARAFSQNEVNGDPLVLTALYNTFYYAFFAVPLGITTSLILALLLNQKVRGITIFRTTFYLPSIVAGVATVILWMYIFNPNFGPLNAALRGLNRFFDATVVLAWIDLPIPKWLQSPQWSKPAMIIMSLWGAGGAGMLIFLAGLQGVPDQLYEVAELDGAGRLRKFWNITLPMLTPTIYFNLVMGIIGALKIFMQAFIMTDGRGGVEKSLLFYVLHLYVKAFVEFEMGYASALAWILFIIILIFTLLVIRSSAVWVYYEGEKKR